MTVSLSHTITNWLLAAIMLCIVLITLFHVSVPETVVGVLAALWLVFFFFKLAAAPDPT